MKFSLTDPRDGLFLSEHCDYRRWGAERPGGGYQEAGCRESVHDAGYFRRFGSLDLDGADIEAVCRILQIWVASDWCFLRPRTFPDRLSSNLYLETLLHSQERYHDAQLCTFTQDLSQG